MATTTTGFLVKDCKVGIVLEMNTQTLAGANITAVGELYDAAANPTYAVVAWNTDVTIDSMGLEQEVFQVNDDNYDHEIDIREIGGGSISAKALDDTVAANLDAYNLWYAAAHFPNGDCNTTTGEDLNWDPTGDVNAGIQTSDLRGYAIVVEKKDEKATPVYYTWTFHNCKISSTPAFSPKSAAVINLTWSDARTFEIKTGAATFVDHEDA
jgi:hypothetical protein